MFSYSLLAACLLLVAVNGCSSPIEKYPYVVSIEYDNVHVGGGSIISRHYVLTTAAVIFESPDLNRLSVRTGSSYSNRHGQVHNVCDARIYPKWSAEVLEHVYAVGLMRLVAPMVFDATRQPIRLFYRGANGFQAGTNVSVSAWPNLFVPGHSNASLMSFEASFGENCTDMTHFAVICMDRPFEADWHRLAGRGHPVVIDDMQAAVLVDSREKSNVTRVANLALYVSWIERTMRELDDGLCSNDCKGNSK